ncbi:MAG: ATP-binding cassette domain-containing protein [Candidatus Cloacimonetes bacterium]|nr:ATP-binding cassette domain-containing protein [Candidatus Cloacimonadota bacterium]
MEYNINDFRFTYPESRTIIAWRGRHEICRGERILLSGASGSGKSTLLYGLMGLIPENVYGKIQGDILYRGKSIIHYPEQIKGKAGLILQNPAAQMLCRSVKEELAFGLENKRFAVNEIRNQISEWSQRLGIEELLERETSSLSGGEKQKVTLLSILMTHPDVLMLDEPTAFLDPESALEIMSIIKDYQAEKTLIFVEHNLNYLRDIITRNLHLDTQGEVIDQAAESIKWQSPLPHLKRTTTGKILLKLDNIRFSFSDKELLTGINLEIRQGEIIAIRGRNGSGKSTLLRIISGLQKKYTGEIILQGEKITTKGSRILNNDIGMLFQNPENHFLYNNIEQELSENIITGLQEEFLGKKQQSPFTLSEGEKRRLSTAIVCNVDKRILLLDEPTFGQDTINKQKLIKLLGSLRDKGLGIIIVSHDNAFLQALSTRTFELKAGKLQQIAE